MDSLLPLVSQDCGDRESISVFRPGGREPGTSVSGTVDVGREQGVSAGEEFAGGKSGTSAGREADVGKEPWMASGTLASAEPPLFPEVDFNGLRSINEQVVGWIYDEASAINYPIVQAGDNAYYLNHMFNGESNRDGCIFLDCRNQSDFSDSHCIIYGHYMKSGAMFAALANYKSQEYYEEHPRMLLLTPNEDYTIEIFAGYVANVQDDAWLTGFASEADYEAWIASSLSKSLISSDISPTASDHILTMSTCSYEFEDARFVLLGVLEPLAAL